ncbi:hypothetical protein ACET3X_001455 [Alternaria dauci]|uniref:RING-type domain-containing protein n=1 Tax=Alternaria dauci TaxID=48095 RepID=A0ABR3UXD7_9PLEO
MFSTFRKLVHYFGGASASTPDEPNDVKTKTVPSQVSSSPQTSDSNSGPAYRAAFNFAAPPTQYANKVPQTPSRPIAPNSALSGYFFSRVKGTDASHINNIQPPQVPLFGANITTSAAQETSHHFTEVVDIEMPDASFQSLPTPSTTIPGESDAHDSPNESLQHDDQGRAAVEVSDEPASDNSSAPVDHNTRPQLITVRPQDRQRRSNTPQPKKNWVDEIEIEEDTPENDLPIGYLGTFRGSRHFIPEYPGMLPCSHNTKHLLLCGHWVSSSEPCGSNCQRQSHTEEPFNCPTCQDLIRNLLTGPTLSAVESTRLRNLKEKGDTILFLSCCVEQVVRAVPEIKTGVTEAVAGLLLVGHGRQCESAENPDPEGMETIEWVVRDMQERTERKQRERIARENSLNTHEKRKSYEEAMNLSVNASNSAQDGSAAEDNQSGDSLSMGGDEMRDALSATNKRQKTKLETHREPTTPESRGTKRSCSSTSSSHETVSLFAFVPGSKRLRTLPNDVYTPPSSAFGETNSPSPPTRIVEAMKRKYGNDVDVDGEGNAQMESGFKRCKVEIWQATREQVEVQTPGFAGFAAAWDENKDES